MDRLVVSIGYGLDIGMRYRAPCGCGQVVLYGTSAGAIGVAFNCDAVAEIFKEKFPDLDVSIHLSLHSSCHIVTTRCAVCLTATTSSLLTPR